MNRPWTICLAAVVALAGPLWADSDHGPNPPAAVVDGVTALKELAPLGARPETLPLDSIAPVEPSVVRSNLAPAPPAEAGISLVKPKDGSNPATRRDDVPIPSIAPRTP